LVYVSDPNIEPSAFKTVLSLPISAAQALVVSGRNKGLSQRSKTFYINKDLEEEVGSFYQ